MGPRDFIRKLYRNWKEHAVTNTAAQLSFYFMLGLFPFLVFLVTLTAYLPLRASVEDGLNRLQDLVPAAALQFLHDEVHTLLQRPKPKLLTVGILTTLWSASRGVDAIRQSLNLAYDVTERRPFWRTQGVALLVTGVGTVLVLASIAMIALGGQAGLWLADRIGLSHQYHHIWTWARWPLAGGVMMLSASVVYWLLPDAKMQFKYVTPGSVFCTGAWLLATAGLTEYSAHFGNYNVTYGSLAGVALLLLWMWISAILLVAGAEMNAILEHADARGKARGARAPGVAPEPESERPSAMPVGATKSAEVGRQPHVH